MNLEILGWSRYGQSLKNIEKFSKENLARVAVENRGGYLLCSTFGELEGIVQGKFIKSTESEADYPKVGDWVEIQKLQGENKAIIKTVLPRFSKLSRRRISKDRSEIHQKQEQQIIATNIDLVFIVQGMDGDFNLARLERYVAASLNGGSEPVILLNKADLAGNSDEKIDLVRKTFPEIKSFLISAKNHVGLEEVKEMISEGVSIVFVGSSGVGKSTLVNAISGLDLQKVQEVRIDDSKGRHTTTKRELILLSSGGILIDTPGMRELAEWKDETVLEKTKKKNLAKRSAKENRRRFIQSGD